MLYLFIDYFIDEPMSIRGNKIYNKARELWPNHIINVFVIGEKVENIPKVSGRVLGDGLFWDPVYGDHVYVVLS